MWTASAWSSNERHGVFLADDRDAAGAGVSGALHGGNRAGRALRRAAGLRRRRSTVRDRQAEPRNVRGALGLCARHGARRSWSQPHGCRPSPRHVLGRARPAFGPTLVPRWDGRRTATRRADSAGTPACFTDRRRRVGREDHARPDPAARGAHRERSRRPAVDRPRRLSRRRATRQFPDPQQHSAPRAGPRERSRCTTHRRALRADSHGTADSGVPGRLDPAQPDGQRTRALHRHARCGRGG